MEKVVSIYLFDLLLLVQGIIYVLWILIEFSNGMHSHLDYILTFSIRNSTNGYRSLLVLS